MPFKLQVPPGTLLDTPKSHGKLRVLTEEYDPTHSSDLPDGSQKKIRHGITCTFNKPEIAFYGHFKVLHLQVTY